MKISYHNDTDSLYVHLNGTPTAESEEVADGTVIHFGEDGGITGIEVYADASEKVDLSSVEVRGLENQRAPSRKSRKAYVRLLSNNAPMRRTTLRFRKLTDSERRRVSLDKAAV